MTTATPNPAPRTIAALDAPLPDVEAEAVLRDAMAHTHSPSDALAYALDLRLMAHPESCSAESSDPEWDAWLAARIAEHKAAWNAAHTTTAGGTA